MSAIACYQQLPQDSTMRKVAVLKCTPAQSVRNALIGLIDAARCAGNREASMASSITDIAARTRTIGSNGLTPNKRERNRCEAAIAPSNPRQQPTAASLAADAKIIRRI